MNTKALKLGKATRENIQTGGLPAEAGLTEWIKFTKTHPLGEKTSEATGIWNELNWTSSYSGTDDQILHFIDQLTRLPRETIPNKYREAQWWYNFGQLEATGEETPEKDIVIMI